MQLYATELVGAEAYDAHGHFVGRVREFFIEPADQPNRISHFLLSRGRFQPLVARYNQVAAVAPGTIRLNCSERELTLYTPNEAWLAVRKDLLDQQIIDTQGRKRQRCGPGGAENQRQCGTAADPGGRGAAWSCPALAARRCGARLHSQIAESSAAAHHPLGIRESDRAGPPAPCETTHHPRETGRFAPGRSGGDDGRYFGRRAPGHHRLP